jgi:hypothetical protein
MYRAFNTFIDDVFAWLIEMPLGHRIACLRDDVVFFVYLYQRYIYQVDKARPNEFGMAYELSPSPRTGNCRPGQTLKKPKYLSACDRDERGRGEGVVCKCERVA